MIASFKRASARACSRDAGAATLRIAGTTSSSGGLRRQLAVDFVASRTRFHPARALRRPPPLCHAERRFAQRTAVEAQRRASGQRLSLDKLGMTKAAARRSSARVLLDVPRRGCCSTFLGAGAARRSSARVLLDVPRRGCCSTFLGAGAARRSSARVLLDVPRRGCCSTFLGAGAARRSSARVLLDVPRRACCSTFLGAGAARRSSARVLLDVPRRGRSVAAGAAQRERFERREFARVSDHVVIGHRHRRGATGMRSRVHLKGGETVRMRCVAHR